MVSKTRKSAKCSFAAARRSVIAGAMALTFGLAGEANAADLPLDMGSEWTGAYIGVFGGTGAVVNELTGPLGGTIDGIGGEGWLAGGMIGLNLQVSDQFVLGVQGDIAKSELETKAQAIFGLAALDAQPDFLASISGRAGWLATQDTLLYVLGGYTYSEYGVGVGAIFGLFQADFKEDFHGFHVGAGIETKISDHLTARVEYRYTDFGGEDFGTGGILDIDPTIHAGTVGLAYNFYADSDRNSGAASAGLFADQQGLEAADWTGFFVGGYFGGAAVVHDITALPGIGIGTFFNGLGGQSFIGGGMFGFNYQFDPRYVLGAQAELGFNDSTFEINAPGGLFNVKLAPELTFSLSARLGWLPTPNTMLYTIGGYSMTTYDAEFSGFGVNVSQAQAFHGIHLGSGIEVALTDAITGRIEYRYTEYESENFGTGGLVGFEPSTHQGTVALAYNFGNPGSGAGETTLLEALGETFGTPAEDVDLKLSGAIEGEMRIFDNVGRQPLGQEGGHLFPTIGAWAKADYRWNNGQDRITVVPYVRGDLGETHRNHFDLREAYYLHNGSTWDILAGVHTVYWGVAESRHLVNVINQTDITADVDEEDKLGQPMINLNVQDGTGGTFSLYGLFGFRERKFPDAEDRLRPIIPVTDSERIFARGGAEKHINFAGRYSNTISTDIGSFDLAASYFYGTNREARFIVGPGLLITPVYDMMHQVGLEGLYATGNLQLKFEGIWRDTEVDDFFAGVGGFEYTINDALGTGANVGLLAEYLYDDRNLALTRTTFDNDIFAGVRVGLNDEANTALLVGTVFDLDDDYSYITVEFSRRLLDDVLLEVELRHFDFEDSNVLRFLNQEDFAQVRITKFF